MAAAAQPGGGAAAAGPGSVSSVVDIMSSSASLSEAVLFSQVAYAVSASVTTSGHQACDDEFFLQYLMAELFRFWCCAVSFVISTEHGLRALSTATEHALCPTFREVCVGCEY